jgi:hypothetical protein
LVFDSEFRDLSSISFESEPGPGRKYNWYGKFFPEWGGGVAPISAFSVEQGILTIRGSKIGTAAPSGTKPGYVGTVFHGGAFFEAKLAFDTTKVRFDSAAPIDNATNWWPSFFALPVEFLSGRDQWPGQPIGYVHFAEADFFEAWQKDRRFGSTMHDWYGQPGCSGHWEGISRYCDIANDGQTYGIPDNYAVTIPDSADWTVFHTIGQLWLSAERFSGRGGCLQTFFDGEPTPTMVRWRQVAANNAPPPKIGDAFGVIDQDHLVVYIGAPTNAPLRVAWVRVWQEQGAP